jgi:hypothetical protein
MVGLADLVFDDACEEACEDDGCETDCPPGQACRCHCPSALPLLSGTIHSAAKLDAPSNLAAIETQRRAHASPDPREILHVPRHVV